MQSTGYSTAGRAPPVEPTQPTTASSDAFRKLLTGSGPSQMNLQAVKDRALTLRKSLDNFINLLQNQPHLLRWDDSLVRFGLMSMQHQQLVEQLRPLLKFYVAHPKAVNQQNAEVLPALLSTMRLPEMDAEERDLLQNHQAAVASEGLSALYERLGTEIDSLNALVEHLSVVGTEAGSGVLDPKGPRRKSMTLDIRAAIGRAEKPVAKVGVAKKEGEGAGSEDALIAAALTGKGL